MIALDTNILVRYLVKSEPDAAEHQIAQTLIDTQHSTFFVPLTVLLELEWVIRGVYKRTPHETNEALSRLCNTRNITIEDEDRAAEALRHFRMGMDFADALHLASARNCESLATFDKTFAKRAKQLHAQPPCITPA